MTVNQQGGVNWNERYLTGDTPWEKGAAAPVLDGLLESGAFPRGSRVLVPGCGYGHDARRLAEAGCRVTGLDIAESAVKAARLFNAGVEGLEFVQGDLFDPALPGGYDLVWEHTCYCAIQPGQRADYVAAVHRLLVEKGRLLGVFFIDTELPPGEGPPFETTVEEVKERFGGGFRLVGEKAPDAAYPGREGREWLMEWRVVPR